MQPDFSSACCSALGSSETRAPRCLPGLWSGEALSKPRCSPRILRDRCHHTRPLHSLANGRMDCRTAQAEPRADESRSNVFGGGRACCQAVHEVCDTGSAHFDMPFLDRCRLAFVWSVYGNRSRSLSNRSGANSLSTVCRSNIEDRQ